ncbi:cation:proton antiporter [Xanthobacter tagetidis]|uniref:cation:proton antiporter domain-containing protein n=1 Tax=Xanthobacter tagetidis TaxID=60216 RepID=UPI0011C3CC4E|nr:cation:proton antiporter [Xanthobacter tagetidis]MBB6307634.1 CPA2 family monovalent cation:H+ antiporter-2 [Xanthobacter tagetidis]
MVDTVLKDAMVYLIAAGVLVPLFHRARIGAVVGFIAIGVLLGPHGLGRLAADVPLVRFITISSPQRVAPFGELGVIFLLFLLGLEFSAARLWALRREVFGAGALQVVLCAAPLAALLYLPFGHPGLALVVGLSLALSSTAVVTQLLVSEHRSLTAFGQLVIAVLLFQDLMVVPILLAVDLLGPQSGDVAWLALSALGKAAAAVVAILLAGRFVLAPLVALAASTGLRDLIMAITLVVVVGAAGLTHAAGLSAALGAFLAGMLLSETAYRHQIEIDLEPFKGLLIGVFFVTVGMSVDIAGVLPHAWLLVQVVAAVLVLKVAFTYAAVRLMGARRPVAAEASVLLAQTGEFALVVLGLLAARRLVDPAQMSTLVTAVVITLALTPLMARLGRRLGARLERADARDLEAPAAIVPLSGHVVIGGFGRVGRTVAAILARENVPFVAVDADPVRAAVERRAGRPVYFGDAGRLDLLERLGGDTASAFVVTLDAAGPAEGMAAAVRARWPKAAVVARARDAAHARRLAALGVSGVIPETVEASLQLAGRLLEALGLPEEVVSARIAEAREAERAKIAGGSGADGR